MKKRSALRAETRLAPLFSSAKDDWETPDDFFQQLNDEFCFTLDAAANERNHKVPLWFGPGSPLGVEDALTADWRVDRFTTAWLNPPYGRSIERWVEKAFREALQGRATVVCLLPARTDTAWWHRYVMRASQVRFIRGRLRFVGAATSAPFPSVIVVFWRHNVPGTPEFRTQELRG